MSNGWRTLILLLVIPVIAFFAVQWTHDKYESIWQGVLASDYPDLSSHQRQQFTLESGCSHPDFQDDVICDDIQRMSWLRKGSIGAGALAILLIGGIAWAGSKAEDDRDELLRLFKPGLRITLWTVVVLVVSESALAIGAIYYVESAAFDAVYSFIIWGIGIGALYAIIAVARAALSILSDDSIPILGIALPNGGYTQLRTAVADLATSIRTSPPDNIVVGLEPNFFVTTQTVVCMNGTYEGRTLYLSLPLCRIIDRQALLAVSAHELGHFAGSDTRYSVEFYPIYRRVTTALATIGAQSSRVSHTIGALPAWITLSYFISKFSSAEHSIGREREFMADRVAARVVSEEAIVGALLKIAAYSPIWQMVEHREARALNEGKHYPNLSELFAFESESAASSTLTSTALETDVPHPMDTHPPLRARIEALGFQPEQFGQALSSMWPSPSEAAASYFPDRESLEVALSTAVGQVIHKTLAAQASAAT